MADEPRATAAATARAVPEDIAALRTERDYLLTKWTLIAEIKSLKAKIAEAEGGQS